MRELNIAYGNNRQAKRWVNKTIKFDDLKERLRVPIRTTESAEEYAKMSRAQRDAAKDHGGFVAGVLKGGRRKVDTVESRSMVALDGDRINAAFLESYESLCPYTSALYTTHSSTEENPRVRLVFPLTRDVTPEEFVAVSRYLAQMLGIDYFDECSYQPNQLMYWPSIPANGSFVYFLGGCDGLLIALVVFVAVDYLTGVICAVSDKKLSSEVGFKGICRKVLIFLLVGIANIVDVQVIGTGSVLRTAVIFFYLSNEGVSLLENAAHLGLPVPEKMKDILAQLHDRAENTESEGK